MIIAHSKNRVPIFKTIREKTPACIDEFLKLSERQKRRLDKSIAYKAKQDKRWRDSLMTE